MCEESEDLVFKGESHGFKVTLRLISEIGLLDIQVQDTSTEERYSQSIDSKFIAQRESFDCFKDPAEIFKFISQNFEKVVIVGGTIRFTYVWKSTEMMERVILIELVKKTDRLELAHLRIDHLKKEILLNRHNFENQLQQQKSQIGELKNDKKKMEGLIQTINQQLKRLEQQDAAIRAEVESKNAALKQEFEHQNENLRKESAEREQALRKDFDGKLADTSAQLRKESAEREQALRKDFDGKLQSSVYQLQKQIDYLNWSAIKTPFYRHPLDTDSSKYFQHTIIGPYSSKLAKKGPQGWYNFVNGVEIQPNQKASYKIKSTSFGDQIKKNIMIGFCTSSGLGKYQNYANPESVYYHLLYYFHQGGAFSKIQGSKLNDVIEAYADFQGGVMRFSKNGVQIKECAVPKGMIGKVAYLSILMENKGDEAEIFV